MRFLFFCVLLLLAAPAWAEQPLTHLLLTEHELDAGVRLGAGTVSFAMNGAAVFAGPDATYVVTVKRGRPSIRTEDGHPAQSHHKSSESVSLGADGALVILADDRRRLQLVRYDGKSGKWLGLDRPIGFVPRGAAPIGGKVVFPQAVRSPAWFVFDVATNSFARVARPDAVPACAGTTFAVGKTAVVTGVDAAGSPCAVSFDPASGDWATLPAPKHAPGEFSVAHGAQTFLLGGKAKTLVHTTKSWRELPPFPHVSPQHAVTATKTEVVSWRINAGEMRQWAMATKTGKLESRSESVELVPRGLVQLSESKWLLAAQRDGRPVLVDIEYAPRATDVELAENRAKLSPAKKSEEVDWKTKSDAERRKGLERGLGAVERYVPPELDEKGKVKTKGAWVFALGEELVVWPVPPKTCQRFIEKMLGKWPTTVVGTTWKTERGAGFARVGKSILYSPAGQCRDAQKCATDYYSQRATPLSQVGPIFSYSEHTSSALDCGDPVNTERWHAIDLRTKKPASMTAVIKPASMLAELKNHKKVGAWVEGAGSIEEALEMLRKRDPTGFGGYAFGGWRSMTRRVEMRIEFHPKSPDFVDPIKIWVEPQDEFIEVFEAAARSKGLFMGSSQ